MHAKCMHMHVKCMHMHAYDMHAYDMHAYIHMHASLKFLKFAKAPLFSDFKFSNFFGLKKTTIKWVCTPQNFILDHFFACSKHP